MASRRLPPLGQRGSLRVTGGLPPRGLTSLTLLHRTEWPTFFSVAEHFPRSFWPARSRSTERDRAAVAALNSFFN